MPLIYARKTLQPMPADQLNIVDATIALSANNPVSGSGNWSIASGYGGYIFDNNDNTPQFTGLPGATYNLVWTTQTMCNISTDTVTISFAPKANINLNYCYDVLRWQYPWSNSVSLISNIESDDAVAGGNNENDIPDLTALDNYNLKIGNALSLNVWNKYSEGIRRCNNLIDSNAYGSNEVTRNIAEAKFLRAYFYFDMLRLFGDIPLNVNNPVKRDSIAKVYAQIESDLLAAILYLPEKSAILNSEIDRATKGAAKGLLGKVFLYEGKWAQAKSQFTDIINSIQYNLLANFNDLWRADYKHTSESLFEIPFYSYPDYIYPNKGNANVMLMGIRNLTNCSEYSTGWGFCKVAQGLANAYKSIGDYQRFDASIIDAELLKANGASFSDPYEYTGYYDNKYSQKTAYDNPANWWQYKQNEIVLRYADVLLMDAEAAYNLGDNVTALSMINAVRSRANLQHYTSFSIDSLKQERRRELALEGSRYFDLVRWGIDSTVLWPTWL